MLREPIAGFLPYYEYFRTILEAAKRIEPDRTGGYICIAEGMRGIPLALAICGELSQDRATKYSTFAQEKAHRLAHSNHRLSWQSRNPELSRYGGAVLCGRDAVLILSFSGFSELMDEAMMLQLAVDTHLMSFSDAGILAALSENMMFERLRQEIIAAKIRVRAA